MKKALLWCFIGLMSTPAIAQNNAQMTPTLYTELQEYLDARAKELDQIPDERKADLRELATFIQEEQAAGKVPQLTFICTHNSRRSHMAQLWMAAAMAYANAGKVATYSGGTEVTAFNPRAVKALRDAGFKIESDAAKSNPNYAVRWSDVLDESNCFSKHYAHESNPQKGFGAVMTCSQADEACPIVFGAAARFAIAYEDPKLADDTPQEAMRYTERCQQIAREMLFVAKAVREAGN